MIPEEIFEVGEVLKAVHYGAIRRLMNDETALRVYQIDVIISFCSLRKRHGARAIDIEKIW